MACLQSNHAAWVLNLKKLNMKMFQRWEKTVSQSGWNGENLSLAFVVFFIFFTNENDIFGIFYQVNLTGFKKTKKWKAGHFRYFWIFQ